MKHGLAAFCTENMAKSMLFLPVEMAPGYLIDARDLHDAVQRMQATVSRMENIGKPKQMELF